MRKTVSLLFVGVSCLAAIDSVDAAEGGAAVFVGDLGSVDRAVLDAADLSAPTLRTSAARPAQQPVRQQPKQGFVTPAAYARSTPAAPRQMSPTPEKAGFFSRMKSALSFGSKPKAPAQDPFAAAQQQARQNAVRKPAGQRDSQVQAIPAFVGNGQNQVAVTAFQNKSDSTGTRSNLKNGGLALRQQAGPRQGLLSGIWSSDSSQIPPQSMPASRPTRRTAVNRSVPKQLTTKQNTSTASLTPRTTPKPTAPRPKARVTQRAMARLPAPAASPFRRSQVPTGGMVLVSDDGQDSATEPAIAKIASKPASAPKVIASKPAPLPAVVVTPKPVQKTTPQPKTIASLPAEPKTFTQPVASDQPAPTPKRMVPNPYTSTARLTLQPKRRPATPPADATEPGERARTLLAEAHGLAASATEYEEFSAVIKRCRYVLAIDKSTQAKAYANQLAGWALTKRGDTLDGIGRFDEARIDYQEAIRADVECWRSEHALGVLSARDGDADTALTHFNRTIELNPEHAKAYSNRAALSVQAGDYQSALRDYGEAITIDPDLAVAHTGRGRVCHMLGNMDEGLQHLDAAAILSPQDAMIATGRGDLLTDLGHYGQALAAYERAIVLEPESPAAYRNLAWMQATCPVGSFRNPEAALTNVERAAQLSGEIDDLTLDTKAAALAALGRFEEAKQLQQEAIELAPNSDNRVYRERLALYGRGETFTSSPVGVRQATYTK